MFATLDPIVRQIRLPSQRRIPGQRYGRIYPQFAHDSGRRLPCHARRGDRRALLLHVVDVSSPLAAEQTAHVQKVLTEIGAERTPQILVLNKSDLLPESERAQDLAAVTHRFLGEAARLNDTQAAVVSGHTGEGVSALLRLIDKHLVQDPVARQRFHFPLGEGRALHLLHDRAAIISKQYLTTIATCSPMRRSPSATAWLNLRYPTSAWIRVAVADLSKCKAW